MDGGKIEQTESWGADRSVRGQGVYVRGEWR